MWGEHYDVHSREIDKTFLVENPHASTNHQRSPCLRFYACICTRGRTWRWTTWAGIVVTLVATEDIMEVMPATTMAGLQRVHRGGIILRIKILVSLLIRFRGFAPNSTRSGRRRFQPRTGLNPDLNSITLNWRKT